MTYETGAKVKDGKWVGVTRITKVGADIDDDVYEKISKTVIHDILSEIPKEAWTYSVLVFILRRIEEDAGLIKFDL